MIPEITFKEFVNNLFGYTQTPINERGGFTALKNLIYNKVSYAYTWGEIEDFINRWLIRVPISKLDDEVNTAFLIMDKIVDDWYLLNYKHEGGRSGYDDEISDTDKNINDFEDFHLHTKIREFIFLRAEEIKKEEEAKEVQKAKQKEPKNNVFEEYLSCENEEQKQHLMEKLERLYKTAKARDGYVILRALEEVGYIQRRTRNPKGLYIAINERFGVDFSQQTYSYNKTIEDDRSSKGVDKSNKLIKSIEEMAGELKQ